MEWCARINVTPKAPKNSRYNQFIRVGSGYLLIFSGIYSFIVKTAGELLGPRFCENLIVHLKFCLRFHLCQLIGIIDKYIIIPVIVTQLLLFQLFWISVITLQIFFGLVYLTLSMLCPWVGLAIVCAHNIHVNIDCFVKIVF